MFGGAFVCFVFLFDMYAGFCILVVWIFFCGLFVLLELWCCLVVLFTRLRVGCWVAVLLCLVVGLCLLVIGVCELICLFIVCRSWVLCWFYC